jgi:hypothetical protein
MRKLVLLGLSGVISLAAFGSACSASDDGDGGFDPDGSGGSGAGTGASGGTGSDTGGIFDPSGTGGSGAGAGDCEAQDPTVDADMDGFFPPEDCNDCDANSNPGAVEVVVTEPDMNGEVPPPADEDCDGMEDNPLPTCDDGLALEDIDANNGARAIDLCKEATGNTWGVMSASYVRADGTPSAANLGVGIFDGFGPNVAVQKGARMLGISSGYARRPGDSGPPCFAQSCSHNGAGTPPAGYPQDVPNCQISTLINDDIALQVQLRAPTNATGYKFRFKFYSFEYAEYVCTFFNDQFVALVDPPPMGANNGNISFDSNDNPVSVNIAFFDVCDPAATDFAAYCDPTTSICPAPPNPFCPSGTDELLGNGFLDAFGSGEDGGGTSWLETTAPITGGDEFSIRFAIWDVQDSAWDSTTLIDSFEWIASGGVDVGTGEVPDPK